MKAHIAHINIFHVNFTSSKRMRDVALFLFCSPPSTSLFIDLIWASFFSSHEFWVFPADGQRIDQEVKEDGNHLICILDTGFKNTPCINCLRKSTLTQRLRNLTYILFWCLLFKKNCNKFAGNSPMFGEGLTICKMNSAPNLFVTYDLLGAWSRCKSFKTMQYDCLKRQALDSIAPILCSTLLMHYSVLSVQKYWLSKYIISFLKTCL